MKQFSKTTYWVVAIVVSLYVLVSCDNGSSSSSKVAISLNKEELFLEVGKSERLVAQFEPFDAINKAHIWMSSDNKVASVDETGYVTGVNVGEAVVIAEALDGGDRAQCNVTVIAEIVSPNKIELNAEEVNLVVGESFVLEVMIKPENATDKSYTLRSLNEGVATVSEDGVITACSYGEAEIEVKSRSTNIRAVCIVYVRECGVEFENTKILNITDATADVACTFNIYGLDVKEAGVCYSLNAGATISDNRIMSSQINAVSCKLSALQPETTYYARSYVIDANDNVAYSKEVSFSTLGILKMDFQLSEVHEDKLVFISDAPKGYTSVNVCYGTEPNPKVTDYTITAIVDNVGKIKIELPNLYSNRKYYVRSYKKKGTLFEYSDDEVSARTVFRTNNGGNISDYIAIYTHNKYNNNGDIRFQIDYYNLPEGTYEVSSSNSGICRFTKSHNLTDFYKATHRLSYINGGKGVFYAIVDFTYLYNNPNKEVLMRIQCVETGVVYIYKFTKNDIQYIL